MQILFSGAIPSEKQRAGEAALLGVLDTDSGAIRHLCEFKPPHELCSAGQKVQFTGFSFAGERLLVCSHNAIWEFGEWPPRKPDRMISLESFNDLHHCLPWRGGLLVANTGLETVDHVSLDGALIERWDLLEQEEGARSLEDERDLRMVPDTKPHLRHPNHVFVWDGEIWVTQLRTSDAVCLTSPARRIPLSVGMPHDGTPIDGDPVFTTTNGRLVRVRANDPLSVKIWDLNDMTPDLQQLGWCRGICRHEDDPDLVFVGFTMLRQTKWREFRYWIRNRHETPPSRVALYDLRKGRLCGSWQMGEGLGYVLFQLHPLPSERRL